MVFKMKKAGMIFSVAALVLLLSGCVIAPPQENSKHHHRHNNEMITRDGATLPDCQTLPDASQADNGSRCWYR